MAWIDHAVREWASIEGLPSAFAAARDGVDVLLRDRGLRRTTPEDTAESLLRGAAASAALEGSPATVDDLRRGAGDQITEAAARTNAELLSLVPVIARSPLQAFARLHALAAAPDDPSRGRPRPDPEVAAALHGLGTVILGHVETPGAVVASLCHAELLRIAPFETANGLVARALERVLLVARGVDPASVLVPEAGHLAVGREAYELALAAYGSETAAGLATWLGHAVTALGQATAASPLAHRR